ncbi:MAG: GTPase ObgE [Clostridia bacterium]|nr:GTPase ObgE [Clostridia bacterium]
MFVDTATITLVAGKGGNGLVSFRREKYVPAGGPDGGDGGNGGNIIFEVDKTMTTLMDFRYKKIYKAKSGQEGKALNSSGKSGEDLIIKVPEGTLLRDAETNKIIADMTGDNTRFVAAKGGSGGWGNKHFATPTRQAPKFAKPGLPGEERTVILELKLLADVGLLGFPNVGKSSLLARVSQARPKIANYHFTTLQPNLGVISHKDMSFVMADIPGLIEGASEGAGRGYDFLRHVDRTRLLLHIVDISGIEGRDPIEDFTVINNEIETFNPELLLRRQIVVGNKCDIITNEKAAEDFREFVETSGYSYFQISAATGQGVNELLDHVCEVLSAIPEAPVYQPEIDIEEKEPVDYNEYQINVDGNVYEISGNFVDKLIASVNFGDEESVNYFHRAIKRRGIIDELEKMGIKDGDTVKFGDIEFDFVY